MFRMIFEMIGFALKFIIALFLIITVGGQLFSTFEEDGAILWPMIAVAVAIVVISFIIAMISHEKKYKDNPDDPNRIYIDGKEVITKEEEEKRSKEFDKKMAKIAWIMFAIAVGAYLLYLYVGLILDTCPF